MRFYRKFLGGLGDVARVASPALAFVPGAGPLVAGAAGLAGSYLGRLNDRPAPGMSAEEEEYRRRYEAGLDDMGRRDEEYLARLEAHDPTEGFGRQTEAQLAAHDENFATRYARSLGSMVGQGRLPVKSGFGMQDTQEMIRQGQRERAAIQEQNAAAAGQARTSHLYRIGDARSASGNRYFDAVNTRYNTLESQRLQDEADRRSGRAAMVGGAMQAAGTLAGAYLGSGRPMPKIPRPQPMVPRLLRRARV